MIYIFIIIIIILIIVQIKQKKQIQELEDRMFELNDNLFWQDDIDNIIERLKRYDEAYKRRVLGESDRGDKHEKPERNGKKKHAIWS